VQKGTIFIFLIFLIICFPLLANSDEDSINNENNSQEKDYSDRKEEILKELSEKVKKANISEDTLKLVLGLIDDEFLTQNQGREVDSIFNLVLKYEVKLRKGETYGGVVLKLKQEITLIKQEPRENKALTKIITKNKDKADKPSKEIKVKEIKEKLKEKKEKIEKEKIKKK
jgi:hypothetical protein